MTEAYDILSRAAASKKGGIRVSADSIVLATLFNALRRERQRSPGFRHLIFKRKATHINILNGNNLAETLEEIFHLKQPPKGEPNV